MESWMATMYRYKPSKPAAVLGIIFGIAMIAFVVVRFNDAEGGGLAFVIFWCLAVVAITGLNTWAAFSKDGSLATFMPFGQRDPEQVAPHESDQGQ